MAKCRIALVAAVLILGTVDTDAAAAQGPASDWILKAGRDIPARLSHRPTLKMIGLKLSGSSGCNNFNAALERKSRQEVAVKGIALTRMLCQGLRNTVEQALVRSLEETKFVTEHRGRLTFLSARRVPLLVWQQRKSSASLRHKQRGTSLKRLRRPAASLGHCLQLSSSKIRDAEDWHTIH